MTKHAIVPKSKTAPALPRMLTAVLPNKVVARTADRWCCPYCGQGLRPTDIDMTDDGLRMVCVRCHHDTLVIEWPL